MSTPSEERPVNENEKHIHNVMKHKEANAQRRAETTTGSINFQKFIRGLVKLITTRLRVVGGASSFLSWCCFCFSQTCCYCFPCGRQIRSARVRGKSRTNKTVVIGVGRTGVIWCCEKEKKNNGNA